MILLILEDQYANKITKEILNKFKTFKIPIKWNIKNPLKYLKILGNIRWEFIILLDNYFPWKWYEEPLGNLFLLELLKTWKNYKIVCISDRWSRLIDEYEWWKQANKKWWVLWFCPNKNWNEICELFKKTRYI